MVTARRAGAASLPSRRPGEGERGQATLEGVIAMVLLATVFSMLIVLIVAIYSVNAANAAIQTASWQIDPAKVAQAGSPAAMDELVEKELSSRVPAMQAAGIDVSNTRLTTSTASTGYAISGDKTSLDLSRLDQDRTTATISFDVSYRLPGLRAVAVTRHVSHDLTTQNQSEVS